MIIQYIKKYFFILWLILFYAFIFSFSISLTIGYYFYYNNKHINILLISLINLLIYFIAFIISNKIFNKINYLKNKPIINFENYNEIIKKSLNDRWNIYKKICFYELYKIKTEILNNPIKSVWFNDLKDELKKITFDNKDISNYKNNLKTIIYYLYTDNELSKHYNKLIKPINSIY